MQTLIDFFSIKNFIPHGYCLSWNPLLLWLHVASDLIITLSYYSIPLSLLCFIRKRKDLPYAWLIVMGALFIVACGTTHLMSAILIWIPLYWLDGYLKLFTAIISVATAVAMLRIIPLALKLPSAAQLQAEIDERKKVEAELSVVNIRFHALFENMQNGVAVYEAIDDGTDFVFRDFNRAAEIMNDISREELLTKPLTKIFPDVERFGLLDVLRRVWQTGKPESLPMSLYQDGRLSVYRENYVYRLPSGEVVAIFEDMTQRRVAELAREEASNRLHKIANQLPSVVFQFQMRVDGSVCMPYANDVFRDVYRLNPEDVREDASAIFAVTHPDDVASHIEKIKTSAQNLSQWRDEYRLKFEDGTERWLAGNALPQREADGSTLWHGFVEDITQRKQLDVNFQKERDKTLALLRNASDGITIVSDKGNVIECSDSFCIMLGYSREEMIGMHVSQWDVGIPKDELMNFVNELFKQKVRAEFETKHTRKDGTTYEAEISGCPIKFGDEWVYFCATRDVTERKTTQQALKASEERLNLSQEYGEIGSWEADLINNKQIWSQAMFQLVKLPVCENLTWEDFFSLVHPDDKQRVLDANQIHLVDKKKYDIEYRVILADGQIRWMRSVGRAEFSPEGTPLRFVGIAQDITERKKIEQALLESEFRWKFALEGAGDGLWDWNIPNHSVFFSHRWKEMLDFGDDELENEFDEWASRIHPEDKSNVFVTVQDYLNGKMPIYICEHRLLCKGGNYKWVVARGMVVERDEVGNAVRMIGTHTDIDKRKHDEQALKESEARFRSIIDISPVPLALNDNHQHITFLNNAFTKTFGYDLDDIPTLSEWWEKAYPDENYRQWVLDTWANTLKQCELENNPVPPMELTICCKDGTQKTVLVSATAISDSFDLHLVALYDITQRKNLEEEIKASEQKLNTILNGVDAFIYIKDKQGCYLYVNHKTEQKFGLPLSSIIGKKDDDFFSAETADNFRQHDRKVIESGESLISEELDVSNGITYLAIKQPIYNSDGSIYGICGVSTDITARKKMELELHRSNADLEQFAYAVSHDMRQPLRMVTSYLTLIEKALETQLDEDTRQFLTFAVDGAKRMDSMILSLLDYSRVGRQTAPLNLISTRVAVDEALAFLKPALETSGGHVHISGDWIDLVASRDELTRLFQNLIGNALKYHEEDKPPVVEVCASVTENLFKVSVKDSGIGIQPNEIERLFKVFSRLQARTRFEGTGVGLALCRKIVEHHGGKIGVESTGEGEGCTFWFEIPILKSISVNSI